MILLDVFWKKLLRWIEWFLSKETTRSVQFKWTSFMYFNKVSKKQSGTVGHFGCFQWTLTWSYGKNHNITQVTQDRSVSGFLTFYGMGWATGHVIAIGRRILSSLPPPSDHLKHAHFHHRGTHKDTYYPTQTHSLFLTHTHTHTHNHTYFFTDTNIHAHTHMHTHTTTLTFSQTHAHTCTHTHTHVHTDTHTHTHTHLCIYTFTHMHTHTHAHTHTHMHTHTHWPICIICAYNCPMHTHASTQLACHHTEQTGAVEPLTKDLLSFNPYNPNVTGEQHLGSAPVLLLSD